MHYDISFLEYFGQNNRYASKLCSSFKFNCVYHSIITIRKRGFINSCNLYSYILHPKRSLCVHFHLFYFTLLNCSKSRCMKYVLWNSEAKWLFIWGMEIKIWMKSPNDPELTCLVLDDWNCADTGCYKRQKNGIKPYLLLTCLYFPTPTSMVTKIIFKQTAKAKALYFALKRSEHLLSFTLHSPAV